MRAYMYGIIVGAAALTIIAANQIAENPTVKAYFSKAPDPIEQGRIELEYYLNQNQRGCTILSHSKIEDEWKYIWSCPGGLEEKSFPALADQ